MFWFKKNYIHVYFLYVFQNIIIIKIQATAGQYSVFVACRVVWKPIPAAKGQWPSHTALVGDLYQIGGEKKSTFIIINMIIRQRVGINNLNHSICI